MTVASFVAAQRTDHGVPHAVSYRALEMSESWFYKWRGRAPTSRQRRRADLDEKVKESFDDSGGTYGSPRVLADLREAGVTVSKKTVEASMRRQNLVARPKKKKRGLTKADKTQPPAPDLLGRDFTAERPNQKWCGDFKQIDSDEGPVFLASCEDLFSRRMLGFALSDDYPSADLATAAINMAVAVRGGDVTGVVFHSDRGTPYTADAFGTACHRLRITQSMGRVGSALDKASVSYCTSLGGFGGLSFGEWASHAFDESWVAGGGRLVEAFVLVVGLVGGEEAGTVPGFDGGGVDAETVGGFGEGEKAAGLEPFGVSGELVGAA